MKDVSRIDADVLVVGAGLAGVMAAMTAAESGAQVCIVSRGPVCSGSSFYPGTWGLGLVGPENEADQSDLEKTILRIGEQMADPELVHTLVSGIADGIHYLQQMNVRLREAENKGEKEFIPCFDHKNRDWHGLEKESAGRIFTARLKTLGVRMLEWTSVLQLLKNENGICGALAVKNDGGPQMIQIRSQAVILATGGMGGLFRYCLNTSDVRGTGQYLALKAGASLVNLEFMQMMPGYIKPAPKTIYNEKMFCYSDFEAAGRRLFSGWPASEADEAMAVRSTHGPFTSRLISAKIDRELFQAFLEHPEGVRVTYQDRMKTNQPEFIKTYFDWLEKEKHLSMDDPIWIGIFAHASNGGIRIDRSAETGVPGLYACGEVTGMMHGADRLGGLSTANGLVFGRIAGRSAAAYSRRQTADRLSTANGRRIADGLSTDAVKEPSLDLPCEVYVAKNAGKYLKEIREWNFKTAMVIRSQTGSEQALTAITGIRQKLEQEKMAFTVGDTMADVAAFHDLEAAIALSTALHQAILLRKESRGSHFRADFPEKSQLYARPVTSRLNRGEIETGVIR